MDEACAACGADDELLFTCRHCERQFCAGHQHPQHDCADPAGDTSGDAGSLDGWLPASALGDAKRSERMPEETTARASSHRPSPGGLGRLTDGEAQTVATEGIVDVHATLGSVTPDRADSTPRTLDDWVRQQSYPALLVKVGILALVVTSAFYGGMAVTMYGLFPL